MSDRGKIVYRANARADQEEKTIMTAKEQTAYEAMRAKSYEMIRTRDALNDQVSNVLMELGEAAKRGHAGRRIKAESELATLRARILAHCSTLEDHFAKLHVAFDAEWLPKHRHVERDCTVHREAINRLRAELANEESALAIEEKRCTPDRDKVVALKHEFEAWAQDQEVKTRDVVKRVG